MCQATSKQCLLDYTDPTNPEMGSDCKILFIDKKQLLSVMKSMSMSIPSPVMTIMVMI